MTDAAILNDRKRMARGMLISLVFWTLFLGALSLVKLEGPMPPEDSMNPLFVVLAPAESIPPVLPREEPVGGTVQSPSNLAPVVPATAAQERAAPVAPDTAQVAAVPSASEPTVTPAPTAPPEPTASPAPTAPPAPLREDPSVVPAPRPLARRPSAFQGGADPFAPLSERSLRAEDLPAPVPTPAAAARTDLETAPRSGPPAPDAYDRVLSSAADRLGAAAPGGAAPGSEGTSQLGRVGGARSAPAVSGGEGNAPGAFDFGEGIPRRLTTDPEIAIHPDLLRGQPRNLETTVTFKISPGGTVYQSTIRFDPPLPLNLSDFLRNAFSLWEFSPAPSDGQVAFRYSIKVR